MTDYRRRVLALLADLDRDGALTDLERLAVLNELQHHLSAEAMPNAVQTALDHGETWAAVGSALGLRSRQHAQQQWSRRLTARRLA